MAVFRSNRNLASPEATLEVLQRLWRTKLKSITLLEKWLTNTADLEIKAGLKAQLLDERRHLRILADEINRLGGRLQGTALDRMLERLFELVQAQADENYKLSAYYHGIKTFTAARCSRMIPFVDQALGRTLEQIARDDAGHIRWAEIRLARVRSLHEQRQLEFFMEKMEGLLNSLWSKSWRQLTMARQRYTSYLR